MFIWLCNGLFYLCDRLFLTPDTFFSKTDLHLSYGHAFIIIGKMKSVHHSRRFWSIMNGEIKTSWLNLHWWHWLCAQMVQFDFWCVGCCYFCSSLWTLCFLSISFFCSPSFATSLSFPTPFNMIDSCFVMATGMWADHVKVLLWLVWFFAVDVGAFFLRAPDRKEPSDSQSTAYYPLCPGTLFHIYFHMHVFVL